MDGPRFPEPLPVGASLRDALRIYRLLFQRSVLVAAAVYAAIALVDILQHVSSGGTAALLGLVSALCLIAGPSLVQGALILIVRNIHEGRRPEAARRLYAGAGSRILSLVGAAFLYAFGVLLGFILLIVPGFYVLARWSLMPAVVMLEGTGAWEARERSVRLVRGHGGAVFMCLLVTFLVSTGGAVALLALPLSFGTHTFLDFAWSSLTAPFTAHLLTVIYYRRKDEWSPVIHPDVFTWESVWEGR